MHGGGRYPAAREIAVTGTETTRTMRQTTNDPMTRERMLALQGTGWGADPARLCVYVDGFNLYYGALKGRTGVRWLDLVALGRRLFPHDELFGVDYFTALVRPRAGNPTQLDDQRRYLRALTTRRELTVHYGTYLPQIKRRPLVRGQAGWSSGWPTTAQFHDSAEKGSDVNLATRLLVDGFNGRYDAAAVISNDGDLKMPVEVIRQELNLPVTIVNPDTKRRSHALSPEPLPHNARYRTLRQSELRASQFPRRLKLPSGAAVTRPANW